MGMATAARAAAMRAIRQPGRRPMTTARARTGTADRCTGWWMCPAAAARAARSSTSGYGALPSQNCTCGRATSV